MSFSFRPAVELLDARELPAIVLANALITSAVPQPPANSGPMDVQHAPTPPVEHHASYDLVALKKL